MNLIPGLSLRASADAEDRGLDDDDMGEFAYDFVELRRDVGEYIGGSPEESRSSRGSLKGTSSPTKTEVPEKTA